MPGEESRGLSDESPAVPVVYLARHGETASNVARRYAGASSEPLTARGREEMGRLALRLQGAGISQVWTSEIARALESAEVLARALGADVVSDPRLNEMRMGPWEGLTEDEVAAKYPADYRVWMTRPDELKLEGRETLDVLARRVLPVVSAALESRKAVVMVTHVAPMRVAALKAMGLGLRLYKRVQVRNAECFQVTDHTGDVRRLGSAESLGSELAGDGDGQAR